MRRHLLPLLLLLFALAGCQNERVDSAQMASGGKLAQSSGGESPPADNAPAYIEEEADQASAGALGNQANRLLAASTTSPASPRPDDANDDGPVQQVARMIIYRAHLTLASHQVEETLTEARSLVTAAGGYVQSSSTTTVTLRVPADAYTETYALIRKLGTIQDERVTSHDITEQFTNLAARAENLEALKARFEALLAQAQTMEARLAIERELLRVTQELSALRDRLAYLADQAAFATITLTVERIEPKHISRNRPAQPFPWVRGHGLAKLFQGGQ